MRFQQSVWKTIKTFSFAITCSIFSMSSAYATLIAPISIVDAEVEFDLGFSSGDTAGNFSVIQGGVTSLNTYAGNTVTTGANPLLGTLTETGDGVGFSGAVDVTDDNYSIGFDSFLSIENTSIADVYEVIFKLTFSNLVNSTGDDAFADSEFTVDANGTEILFSDLISDSSNGNEVAGNLTGDFGGELIDSDTLFFDFVMNPGDILELGLSWTLEGGDFDGGNSIANFSQFLSVDSATLQSTQPPKEVPEPATLLLFAMGILGLRRKIF